MIGLEVHRELAPAARAAVLDLVAEVQRTTGVRPLSDHLWLELVHGGRDGSTAILARDGDRLAGFCQLVDAHGSWLVELVISPHRAGEGGDDVARRLLAAAVDEVGARGGGRLQWWVADADDADDALAAGAGLTEGRALLQLRVPLPLALTTDVATRPFEVGRDEEAWIEVNNAAFSWHAEQGGWDVATLRQREREPWFDPDGFLLHERAGRLAAFCWTKVHADTDPVLGEIYVIAVHPDFHGLGLGRALTVAGLHHLASRGIRTGMLFVDRSNTAAVELYRSLGFVLHRTDRAFVADVPSTDRIPR